MREIKFRAWRESQKRFVTWEELIHNSEDLVDALTGVKYGYVEQFTGLTDKNRNEIYEGDLVKNEHTHKIRFDIEQKDSEMVG